MVRYISFLYVTLLKKPSTYIIPILGLSAIGLIFYMNISNNNDPTVTGLVDPTTYLYFFPFIFSAVFISVKAINIFKDGEIDGMELLVASKKISRKSIVIGKFLTLYSLIATYSLLMFIVTFAVSGASVNATSAQKLNFAASNGVGGFIVMLFISSLIIFISSYLGKIGSLSLSIVIATTIPIISIVTIMAGNGSGMKLTSVGGKAYGLKNNGNDNYSFDTMYLKRTPYNDSDKAEINRSWQEYEDGFYHKVGAVDIWQHLSSFYKMFQTETYSFETSGIEWKFNDNQLDSKDVVIPVYADENPISALIAVNNPFDDKGVEHSYTKYFKGDFGSATKENSAFKSADFWLSLTKDPAVNVTPPIGFVTPKDSLKQTIIDRINKEFIEKVKIIDKGVAAKFTIDDATFAVESAIQNYLDAYLKANAIIQIKDINRYLGTPQSIGGSTPTQEVVISNRLFQGNEIKGSNTDEFDQKVSNGAIATLILQKIYSDKTIPVDTHPSKLAIAPGKVAPIQDIGRGFSEELAISFANKTLVPTKHFSKNIVLIIYSLIVLLSSAGVFWRYMRKDFK